MKPTKEQLADPKWWNESANGYDCVYECTLDGDIAFAGQGAMCGGLAALKLNIASWKLLAERPKAEWMPEIGDWFISSGGAKMAFIGIDSRNAYVCEIKGGGLTRLYDFLGCKPIKTQREELIDIIDAEVEDDMGIVCIADAILARFYLTEKDGN